MMAVIYVTEQGAVLTKKSGRLIVSTGGSVQADVPLMHVDQIVAYGNVHLTTPVITHCFQEGIDVCFLSSCGTYRGRLQIGTGRDVDLRRRQYERCGAPAFALGVAQAVIVGKIQNQIAFWHRRVREGNPQLNDALLRQKALLEKARSASTIDALRGFEGASAKLHFQVFGKALRQDLPYSGRRERPATDPVNAMLNLGYTLLYNNIHAALAIAGLDPYLGCLHQVTPGHAALASDLVEEFRAVVVDTQLVMLVNHKEVTAADFRRNTAGETQFNPNALRRFLARYNQRLDTPTLYTPKQARFTYRQIFELQARHLARVIRGEETAYRPYRWDW